MEDGLPKKRWDSLQQVIGESDIQAHLEKVKNKVISTQSEEKILFENIFTSVPSLVRTNVIDTETFSYEHLYSITS